MKNIFEMFEGSTPEKPKSDSAGYVAVPEYGGKHDGDVNMEGRNIENEIKDIKRRLASDEDEDRAFLQLKLENLEAQLEKMHNS